MEPAIVVQKDFVPFKLYQGSVYNIYTGEIYVKAKLVTAKNDEGARIKVLSRLGDNVDLDDIKVVLTPLG